MSNTMSDTARYTVLLSDLSAQRIQQYAQDLQSGQAQPGGHLAKVLETAEASGQEVLAGTKATPDQRKQVETLQQIITDLLAGVRQGLRDGPAVRHPRRLQGAPFVV